MPNIHHITIPTVQQESTASTSNSNSNSVQEESTQEEEEVVEEPYREPSCCHYFLAFCFLHFVDISKIPKSICVDYNFWFSNLTCCNFVVKTFVL